MSARPEASPRSLHENEVRWSGRRTREGHEGAASGARFGEAAGADHGRAAAQPQALSRYHSRTGPRPPGRLLSRCADGVPTLMFRAANQRGNQILDAAITVTLARQAVTSEGIAMRRFEELPLMRSRTSLFALSWTVMHRIDENSPLSGIVWEDWCDRQM